MVAFGVCVVGVMMKRAYEKVSNETSWAFLYVFPSSSPLAKPHWSLREGESSDDDYLLG